MLVHQEVPIFQVVQAMQRLRAIEMSICMRERQAGSVAGHAFLYVRSLPRTLSCLTEMLRLAVDSEPHAQGFLDPLLVLDSPHATFQEIVRPDHVPAEIIRHSSTTLAPKNTPPSSLSRSHQTYAATSKKWCTVRADCIRVSSVRMFLYRARVPELHEVGNEGQSLVLQDERLCAGDATAKTRKRFRIPVRSPPLKKCRREVESRRTLRCEAIIPGSKLHMAQ
ncbi:hypothetical protein BD310DRAFT_4803 [Dichomitus squalens]|uniref:Uncharacterized protein n=1 Tax=Dichomitus squalens TaxID=114155 RepID=A0A4Q9QC78_9APHY|nr:hypothetical protein BD310DRAFT_4803 [Dichomitus squalens]